MADVDDTSLERKSKKKQKKKKKKEHDMTEDDVIRSPKKHKKRKRGTDEDHLEISTGENGDDCELDEKNVEVRKKKKKKKKNKEIDDEDEIGMPPALKKKKNKEKEIPEKIEESHEKGNGEMKKKHKKNKKNKESREELTDNIEIDANDKTELKKKRRSDGSANDTSFPQCKKSKSSKSLIETDTVDDQESVCTKKKKKKRKHSSEETLPNVEMSPKKSKKDKKYSGDIDTVHDSKSASNGNVDTSNTVKNVTEPVVGQWGTSSLGNDVRQQKFIRLLGGLKKGSDGTKSLGTKQSKGLFGSLKATPSTMDSISRGGNKAMDASQEKLYLTNMEKDYERAMSMNLNRGIGLGFEKPPGEGKKFYIDTKASKSIKFDD
ncbi:lysine-rich nucleolar protein 1-like [Pecten maximus]|uniref:lysine-rich nucleolar protein 1-like n=1 Tax=Pecten maximus TaxID=6579 RepID=UPI001458014A|nr:lysine-rich nucleolar protein 1-like [Pecten maximus]